jgi:hypothetical protein
MMRDLSKLAADVLPPGQPGSGHWQGMTQEESGGPCDPMSFAPAIAGLDTIPGVDQRLAELLVAEGGLTCAALARRAACRPGPAWPLDMMRARGSSTRGRPARVIARGAQD